MHLHSAAAHGKLGELLIDQVQPTLELTTGAHSMECVLEVSDRIKNVVLDQDQYLVLSLHGRLLQWWLISTLIFSSISSISINYFNNAFNPLEKSF